MIRINKWQGLVTAASPYILPPGGAVEQVNAQSRVPGQLTVRDGMRVVSASGTGSDALLEIWGYSPGSGASDKIFAFTDAGDLVILTGIS